MQNTLKILVIEDNLADYVLLKKALNMIEGINIETFHAKDGQEGLDYVFKQGKHSNSIAPDIIILDLNLPIKSGFEVLKSLKDDISHKVIPVIIYSTSDETKDVCASYSLYANSYIIKTFGVEELFEKIKYFGQYWTKSVKIPDKEICCIINKEKK